MLNKLGLTLSSDNIIVVVVVLDLRLKPMGRDHFVAGSARHRLLTQDPESWQTGLRKERGELGSRARWSIS